MTMEKPTVETFERMLREEWAPTAISALEDMIKDIRDGIAQGEVDFGKLENDTLERDFDYLRHLMGRREVLAETIRRYRGGHRRGTGSHV